MLYFYLCTVDGLIVIMSRLFADCITCKQKLYTVPRYTTIINFWDSANHGQEIDEGKIKSEWRATRTFNRWVKKETRVWANVAIGLLLYLGDKGTAEGEGRREIKKGRKKRKEKEKKGKGRGKEIEKESEGMKIKGKRELWEES